MKTWPTFLYQQKQDLGSTALRLSIWSRVLILVQMSSRLPKVSPDFDRQVTSCFIKMYLLLFEESRDDHTSISALTQFGILYVSSWTKLEDILKTCGKLGACEFLIV